MPHQFRGLRWIAPRMQTLRTLEIRESTAPKLQNRNAPQAAEM